MTTLDHIPSHSLIDGDPHRRGVRDSVFMSRQHAMRLIMDLQIVGWGQKKVAQELGCSDSLVSWWATGRCAPREHPYGVRLVRLHKENTK